MFSKAHVPILLDHVNESYRSLTILCDTYLNSSYLTTLDILPNGIAILFIFFILFSVEYFVLCPHWKFSDDFNN